MKAQNLKIDFVRLFEKNEAPAETGFTIGCIHFKLFRVDEFEIVIDNYMEVHNLNYHPQFEIEGLMFWSALDAGGKLWNALAEKKIIVPVETKEGARE